MALPGREECRNGGSAERRLFVWRQKRYGYQKWK